MIGIVCFWDRAATPYLAKYEQMLKEQNAPFEVLMWSRKASDKKISQEGNIITKTPENRGILEMAQNSSWPSIKEKV